MPSEGPSAAVHTFASGPSSTWSQYQGDAAHDGSSPYVGPATSQKSWTATLASGVSGLAASDGTLVVDTPSNGTLMALSLSTGHYTGMFYAGGTGGLRLVSNYPVYDGSAAEYAHYVYSCGIVTCSVYGSNIAQWSTGGGWESTGFGISSDWLLSEANSQVFVTASGSNALYALSYGSGAIQWTDPFHYDLSTLPAVGAGLVVVGFSNSPLVAGVQASGGAGAWNFTADGAVGSPAIAYSAGDFYFGSTLGTLYAVNSTGVKLWSWNDHTLPVTTTPAVAFGDVFLGDSAGTLWAMNATSGASVWNFSAGAGITTSPVVSANHLVYFATTTGLVEAVNATTGALVWSASVGSAGVDGLVLADGQLIVENASNALTSFQSYPITFVESGLATGANWSVTLNGSTEYSKTASITFSRPPGTYPYTVDSVAGYSSDPVSGTENVSSSGVTQYVNFTRAYPVTFVASGLSPGTNWTVTAGSPPVAKTNTTTVRSHGGLVFLEPQGPLTFAITAPSGYGVAKVTGPASANATQTTASVATVPLNLVVTFGPLEILYFNESALPQFRAYSGAVWSVALTPSLSHGGPPSQSAHTNGTSITFLVPHGATYHYYILTPGSEYKAAPSFGTVGIPEHYLGKIVKFTLLVKSIVFHETGLTSHQSWTVTLTSGTSPAITFPLSGTSTAGGLIKFKLPVGTYNYTITATDAQTPSPSPGSFSVLTAPSPAQTITISFS